MKSVKLVLVLAALLYGTTIRAEFSHAADGLGLAVSSDSHQDQRHSQNSERSIPVEEKEVKESVSDTDNKICVNAAISSASDQFRWATSSHQELRYFCSARELFNNLGRLRL
jgi:hypothetical protein